MSAPDIHGQCPPEFEAVREAFARNFRDAPGTVSERGARFSVQIEGRLVIDLWGGHADAAGEQPFGPETLTPVFSTGKAVMALMMARLVDQGLIGFDTPLVEVWPAFGEAGKADITLGDVLSHQAGMVGFAPPQPPEIWFEREQVLDAVAAQAPLFPPRSASGYSPIMVGYICGEVFRRLDGRSMGTALREDLAGPFDLDLWWGLPAAQHGRVAQMRKPPRAPDLGNIDAVRQAAFLDRGSAPAGRGSAEWRQIEIPSANMHARADALARLMGVVASGGMMEGERLLSENTVAFMSAERISGPDRVLPFTLSWAAGLMRNEGLGIFGSDPGTLGHCGWGGSCAFADPAAGLSGAYVMSAQSHHLIGDPRARALVDALYASL